MTAIFVIIIALNYCITDAVLQMKYCLQSLPTQTQLVMHCASAPQSVKIVLILYGNAFEVKTSIFHVIYYPFRITLVSVCGTANCVSLIHQLEAVLYRPSLRS